MKERKTFQAPRELIKWLEKLNLSYKVSNFKRDMSNGYLTAEILYRHDNNINMNYFQNKFDIKSKSGNWDKIREILRGRNFEFAEEQLRKIMYMEGEEGFRLAVDLYKHFTSKNLDWKKRPSEKSAFYQNQTVNFLMKNREVNSRCDYLGKQKVKLEMIENHLSDIKRQRGEYGIKKFIIKKKNEVIKNYLNTIKENRYRKESKEIEMNLANRNAETRLIKLKKYHTSKTSHAENLGFKEKRDSFLIGIGDTIEKHFKHVEKSFIFSANNFLEILFDPNSFESELLDLIFKIMTENIKEIHEKISNNVINFYFLFVSLVEFMNKVRDTPKNYLNVLSLIEALGNIFFEEEEEEFLTVFMENSGFELIKKLCISKVDKIRYGALMVHYLSEKSSMARVRSICRLKEVLANKLEIFYNLLANLSNFPILEDEEKSYFNLMLYYAIIAFQNTQTTNVVAALKIMFEICDLDPRSIAYELMDLDLERVLKLNFWEIEGLLILLASKILLSYDQPIRLSSQDLENSFNFKDSNEIDIVGSNSQDSRIQSISESRLVNSPSLQEDCRFQESDFRQETESFYLGLIHRLFAPTSNTNVIRLGLVYLAPILESYPGLIALYLSILLSIQEQILFDILAENNVEEKLPLVRGCKSFHYYQRGSHLKWFSLGITQALHAHFQNERLTVLNSKYCFIILQNLKKPLKEEESSSWLQLFLNFEFLLINSFSKADISENVFEIIKQYLSYPFIRSCFVQNSFNLVFRSLTNIYAYPSKVNSPSVKNTFKNFLSFLSQEQDFFEFVYTLLKKYSETDFKLFRKTNLSKLMNRIASRQRNLRFGENTLHNFLNNF